MEKEEIAQIWNEIAGPESRFEDLRVREQQNLARLAQRAAARARAEMILRVFKNRKDR